MCCLFLKWRYSIRIENVASNPVILRERHWRIFSQAGTFETVRGKGVVGHVNLMIQEILKHRLHMFCFDF